MSNTFDGVLREFPYIGIDRFNTSASIFLLTHCHADHLAGFANKSFTGIVYCSKETKRLLELDSRLRNSFKLVEAIPYNIRTRLETPHGSKNAVFVTLIEAYHCLGASMFLLEEFDACASSEECPQDSNFDISHVSRAVLCTGDLRAEKWWCEIIRLSPALFPYISEHRPLDCIYFDSTFAYRQEPYIEIPPNNHGIHAAISMLREYPKNDPEIAFEFSDTTLGFEQAWAFIVSYFGGSLRVENSLLKKRLQLVVENDPVNGKVLGQAMEKSASTKGGVVFHGGNSQEACQIIVKIKQCINFNIRDYTGVCCPISIASLPSTEGLQLLHTTASGNQVYEFLGRRWIIPRGGQDLLPLEVKLLFSRHSSYSEVKSFLAMFSPRQVYPCFYSQKVWYSGFVMARVFGELCSDNEFNFDNIMTLKYGAPPQETLDRPVVTINRWNIEECDKEQKFIEQLMEENRKTPAERSSQCPALINLRKVVRTPFRKSERSSEDFDFLRRRTRDFSLQRFTEGRRKVNYEKFVKEQQMLYYKKHNLPQYQRDYSSPKYSRDFTSALGGSSDYDTDSCTSSFDLLEKSKKPASPGDSTHDGSFVHESQHGLFWKVHKLPSPRRHFMQTSLIKSSFDSFEEDRTPERFSNHHSIYYHSEGRVDQNRINELSASLASTPCEWKDLQLDCIV